MTSGIAFHELCGGDPPTRVLVETEHFAVIADLAPLVEGHLLLVPRWHALSFGHVPHRLWPELETLEVAAIKVLEREYGTAPMIAEHGSSSCLARACISHAHWHLVPAQHDLPSTFVRDGLVGRPIDNARQLMALGAADTSYLYFYNPANGYRMLYEAGLSKRHQYLRVVLAEHIGIPDPEWDWAHTQNLSLLRSGLDRLGSKWRI